MKHFPVRWNGKEFSFGFGKFSTVSELLEHFESKPVIGGESGEGGREGERGRKRRETEGKGERKFELQVCLILKAIFANTNGLYPAL